MKILITGGHPSPALAIIDSLKKIKKNVEIVFVGTKYTSPTKKTLSFEYKEIQKRNVKFLEIKTGRLNRTISTFSFKNILLIPVGFFLAEKIIREEKPDVVLSFGSHIALPICIISFLHKIPVFTHEQTINPGLANKVISKLAKKIFISFQEASKFFPKNKTILTGNPIRKSIFYVKKRVLTTQQRNKPVIYITGGSLGSHSINIHIKNILPELLKKYIVIHQVGNVKKYDDLNKLLEYKKRLGKIAYNYILNSHFLDDEIGYIFKVSSLVVSRAGANTFFELLSLKKPTIFIPLPWSANKEQKEHALFFKKNKIGEIFYQKGDSKKLLKIINRMMRNLSFYKKNFQRLQKSLQPQDADMLIIKEILSVSDEKKH